MRVCLIPTLDNDQCLRLIPKKLMPISSLIKKNTRTSLRKGFSKKMFSLLLRDMSTTHLFQQQTLRDNSLVSYSLSTYSSWISFYVILLSLDGALGEWLIDAHSKSDTLNSSICYVFSHTNFDLYVSFMSFID